MLQYVPAVELQYRARHGQCLKVKRVKEGGRRAPSKVTDFELGFLENIQKFTFSEWGLRLLLS
jgi:hypothetical protein